MKPPTIRTWAIGSLTGLLICGCSVALAQPWLLTSDLGGNLQAQFPELVSSPQIIAQPQQQIVPPGSVASFFVVAADTRGLTYQWRFSGTNINGATGDALMLTNVSAANEGQYSVVLSNSSSTVTSSSAALMIDSDGDGLPDSWEMAYFGN